MVDFGNVRKALATSPEGAEAHGRRVWRLGKGKETIIMRDQEQGVVGAGKSRVGILS